MVNIKVKGVDVDKYITLTLLLVDNTLSYECLSPENHLVQNGPEVTQYLEREIMNEECLPLDLSTSKYTSMNRLFIT